MEQRSYVSCIKINGVPILPPLMTENLRTEMNYYKQLAVAVEERLKALEIEKQGERDKCMEAIAEEERKAEEHDPYDSTTENCSTTETDTSTIESAPNIETVVDFPTKENARELQLSSLDTSVSEYATETVNQSCKSLYNDGEDESKCKTDEIFTSSACSDTITASTDLNQYLDSSPPMKGTPPEPVKPQVPKTLDIVPIIVDVPKVEKSAAESSSVKVTERNTPPKLVRQGSYILEAPSPMLLAHMQTELANPGYVPTATATAIKRKEWNISQAKTEWEKQVRNKEFIIPDKTKSSYSQGRCRRNSMSTVNNQKIFKSFSYSKNYSSSLGMHQSARSVDCIQTMLDRELVCKSPGVKTNSYNDHRHNVRDKDSCTTNNSLNNSYKWKSSRNVSILNMANRLGGSLGNLTNFGGQSCRTTNTKSSDSRSTIIEDTRSLPSPSKSVAMSEKLVIIFKEIQRKHEEQMADLIAKQQREQKNMQKEFEKQQVLLLGQIKKTFPGISIPQPVEMVPEVSNDISLSYPQNLKDSKLRTEYDEVYGSDDADPPVAKCPLDYIYPLNNGHCEESSCNTTSSRLNDETLETQASEGDQFHLENSKTTERSAEKYSNVSRQLFPLDSNTVHVPVPVNVLYTAKHIQAATVINAYARGYLVRRMMRTERVVALKSTYKEALHCMLKLHVDAPLNLPELNFHQRLQLQCDAASMNIAELFAQGPEERMQVISQDREIKRSRSDRPSSAHSYSFATQRTLARKKLKEMGDHSSTPISRPCSARSRCQTWTSNSREKRAQNVYHGIKRSTSAGTVRKPWR